MWLFDNLFLDKNTPMAINTGESHPGDASQASTTGGASQSSSSWGNPPQPPIQEEIKASSPVEATEVKPETNLAPANGTTFLSDIPTSFDIGGFDVADTSANTWVNTIPSVLSNDSSSFPQIATTVPSQSSDEVSFIVSGNPVPVDSMISDNGKSPVDVAVTGITVVENAEILPTEAPVIDVISTESPASGISIIDTLSVESPAEPLVIAEVSPEKNETETTLAESPLTTLMSWFGNSTESTSTNPQPDMSSQNPPVDQKPLVETSSPPMDSLFSLGDISPSASIVDVVADVPAAVDEVTPLVMDVKKEEEKADESNALITPLEEKAATAVHSMNEFGKELARMTRSPRLQGKLTGFISELEELSNEEERLKAEKRKQIESYQLRIEELKKEYETRIHALELEEADLNKQITVMDEERHHITQVIEGFKRELEVV